MEGGPLDQLAEKSEEASFEMPSEKVKIKAVYREIEDGETKRYPIRVQDGVAMQDGNIVFSAEKGKKIVLEYNGAIEHFTKWHVVKGNLALEEDYGNFYFIMPEEEVEIKAITTEPKYQITVTGGKANDVISGKEVTTAKKYALLGIKAEYDPATHVFVKWEVVKGTEDSFFGVSIQSEYFEFVMPEEDIELRAIYRVKNEGDIPRYKLEVENGFAYYLGIELMTAQEGTPLTLEAQPYWGDKPFKMWQILEGDFELYGSGRTERSFIMPAQNVKIKAVYEGTKPENPKYTIRVIDGKAKIDDVEVTESQDGSLVEIEANPAPVGKTFKEWKIIKGSVALNTDGFPLGKASFVMPAEEVEIQAIYTDQATTAPEVLLPYIPEQEVEDETIPQGDPKEDDKKKDDKSEEERDKSKESTDSKDSSKGEKDKTDGKPEDKTDSKTDTDGKTDNAPTTDAKGDTALKDTKDETITESEVPKGVLPKTAGAPFALFWLFGVGISGMGVWIKKRR